jgi:DNA-binding transcriptional regulator of glucitol operon
VRQYQKVIRKCLGRGVLGVGQRRGLFAFGELLVLVYNSHEDKVITVQSLKGFSIFARFVELPVFTGLSLVELRRQAAKTRKRSALNRAIKAVEKHLRDSSVIVAESR